MSKADDKIYEMMENCGETFTEEEEFFFKFTCHGIRPKNTISLLRGHVNHYSFVTGLTGKLAGKSGGPEDCSVGLNVLLHADIFEGVRVDDPRMFSALEPAPYYNVLKGHLFECCDLLSFVAGTYGGQDLRKGPEHYISPKEFTIEIWECQESNEYEWQLKRHITYEGVKWLDAAHTGDGGDRCCAGIATFTCEKKTVEEVENGEITVIPNDKHPTVDLRRILQQQMDGPKHPASYMG